MKNYAVILAAGKGTRMRSLDESKSKVSYEILEKPLVRYVLDALKPLNFEKIITVVGFGGEVTKSLVKDSSEIVWQHEQKGTGHAVMQAAPILEGKEGYTVVCCGDTPVVTKETFEALLNKHINDKNSLTLLTAVVDNPKGYGRIKRNEDGSQVEAIVEQADCDDVMDKVKEVNAGMYVFDNVELFKQEIIDMSKKGSMIIFSSHRMEHVELFCKKLVILMNGRSVISGYLKDIKEKYRKKNINIKADIEIEKLEKIKGVISVTKKADEYVVKIEDSSYIENVFKVVSKAHNVVKFVVEEASLNEIFVEKVGEEFEK